MSAVVIHSYLNGEDGHDLGVESANLAQRRQRQWRRSNIQFKRQLGGRYGVESPSPVPYPQDRSSTSGSLKSSFRYNRGPLQELRKRRRRPRLRWRRRMIFDNGWEEGRRRRKRPPLLHRQRHLMIAEGFFLLGYDRSHRKVPSNSGRNIIAHTYFCQTIC